jgi:predicted ABC-type ATPase
MLMGQGKISMPKRKPVILVFAGPNGSGKTTINRNIPVIGTYINADDIKKEHGISDIEAAQQAELLRISLVDKKADFSFETVLSTERNLLLLEKAKTLGYEVQCIYVLTCDANINVARVKARVASGGHDVPEEKVKTRYYRALTLLPRLINVCDMIFIYDNSGDEPSLIYSKVYNDIIYYPNNFWIESDLHELIR